MAQNWTYYEEDIDNVVPLVVCIIAVGGDLDTEPKTEDHQKNDASQDLDNFTQNRQQEASQDRF